MEKRDGGRAGPRPPPAGNRAAIRHRRWTGMHPRHSGLAPRAGAPRGYSSQKDPLPKREDQERVERRDDVIGHHAEAVMPLAVDEPGPRRRDAVSRPEQ